MTAQMALYRIVVRGQVVGAEFGASPQHALERYSAGSIYCVKEMTAVYGWAGSRQAAQ